MKKKTKIEETLLLSIVDQVDTEFIKPTIYDNPTVIVIHKNNYVISNNEEVKDSISLIINTLNKLLNIDLVRAEQIVRLSFNKTIVIGVPEIFDNTFNKFLLVFLETNLKTQHGLNIIEVDNYENIKDKLSDYITIGIKNIPS